MSAKENRNPGGDQEAEVWSAISAFEQILEAMPNDRTSLETLAHAYEQIGDLTRAKDYSLRLAEQILAEEDHEAAGPLAAKLAEFAQTDDSVIPVLRRVEKFLNSSKETKPPPPAGKEAAAPGPAPAKQQVSAVPSSSAAAATRSTFNITTELPMAWNLLKANELTQEEYSSVVQDLTEMSSKDAAVPVSVLHVLNDRGFKNLPKIMTLVAKECGTPVVSLTCFELQSGAFSLLPLDFIIRRGVIPFDFFGDALLVVIMNPYDKQLMKDIENITGKTCFFYMTPPMEFDAALGKINAWMEQSETDNR